MLSLTLETPTKPIRIDIPKEIVVKYELGDEEAWKKRVVEDRVSKKQYFRVFFVEFLSTFFKHYKYNIFLRVTKWELYIWMWKTKKSC